jgi:Polysaccharide biosynthesis protein
MLDRGVRLAIGAIISIWIARYLGPSNFGTLSYAIAFVSLFATFATLGLDNIVIRDLVRVPGERHEIMGTAFALKAGGGAVAALAALGGIFLLRPHDTTTEIVVAVVAAGTIFTAFDIIDFSFQSEVASKYVVYARLSAFAVSSIARVALPRFSCGGHFEIGRRGRASRLTILLPPRRVKARNSDLRLGRNFRSNALRTDASTSRSGRRRKGRSPESSSTS